MRQSADYQRGYRDGMRHASELASRILEAYRSAEQLVTFKIQLALADAAERTRNGDDSAKSR